MHADARICTVVRLFPGSIGSALVKLGYPLNKHTGLLSSGMYVMYAAADADGRTERKPKSMRD